jgi:hypothetical protein
MRILIHIFLALSLCFSSCETLVHLQGHVYDDYTKQPIDSVKVLHFIGGLNDFIRKDNRVYNTITYSNKQLKDLNIKSAYSYNNASRRIHEKFIKAKHNHLTDVTGQFDTEEMFAAGAPRIQLVFIKDGYKPIIVKPKKSTQDSIKIFLEKIDQATFKL